MATAPADHRSTPIGLDWSVIIPAAVGAAALDTVWFSLIA
jgi:hypothetical protein